MSCVWTSAPAWAQESHTAGGRNRERPQVRDYTPFKITGDASIGTVLLLSAGVSHKRNNWRTRKDRLENLNIKNMMQINMTHGSAQPHSFSSNF